MSRTDYVFGTTEAEHGRLIRQADVLAPYTERFFLDAGIAPGQRVLDIGCGVGDVSLLVARLVGPMGHVVGVDQDEGALATARSRAAGAGVAHTTFIQEDVTKFTGPKPFDAVVGRLILQFLPNPGATLRHLTTLIRPNGVVAFQEPSWSSFQGQTAHLPLRATCARLVQRAIERGGGRTNMELVLFQEFRRAGLSAVALRLDTPVGDSEGLQRWLHDLFLNVLPRLQAAGESLEALGDLATLAERLESELEEYNSYAACIALVGAAARRP
jgi:ubiquinone/menaquinone biosynthesis C-methylase UbiE